MMMVAEVAKMQAECRPGGRVAPEVPADFENYVLRRHDQYARGALNQGYQGLNLHRHGHGADAQVGPNQWNKAWADYLDGKVKAQLQDRPDDAIRWARVEGAILQLEQRDRRYALVLRFYATDPDIRDVSVRALAGRLGVDEDQPRRMLPRALRKAWKLMGEVW